MFHPLVLSFFSISLAENALVTALIISKILTEYRDIQKLTSPVGHGANRLGRRLVPTISISDRIGCDNICGATCADLDV